GIRVAIEENQGLQPVLEAPLRAFNNRLSELEATLNAVMVDSTPAPIFRQQLEGSIAANLALWDAAAAQLDDLLQRRIARLERQRSLTLGLSLLMVGLAGYLLGGFYRALMATVN